VSADQARRRGGVYFPEDNTKDFVKRIIGVAGDTVEVRDKKVYINGKQIDDSHAQFEADDLNMTGRDYDPKTVPENHIFVMGDNRDRSYDSRFWGYVSLDAIRGKAFLIYFSWDGGDR
jgi:signal peptidase I